MSKHFAFNPKLDFVIERFIDAPARLVWDALTRPEHLKEWYMPKPWGAVAHCEMDVRPGGRLSLRVRFEGGPEFALGGTYQEVDPPRRLVHTWAMAGDPSETTVTFELRAELGQTRVVLTHVGFAARADLEQNDAGWQHQLDRLVTLLESMAAAMARFILAPPAAGERRAQVRCVVVRLRKPDVFGGRAIPSVEIQRDESWYETREVEGTTAPARIEILQETRQTGAYRIHLPATAQWSPPPGMALQMISGRVIVSGQEIRARSVLPEGPIATPDEVPASLLGIRQPPLSR